MIFFYFPSVQCLVLENRPLSLLAIALKWQSKLIWSILPLFINNFYSDLSHALLSCVLIHFSKLCRHVLERYFNEALTLLNLLWLLFLAQKGFYLGIGTPVSPSSFSLKPILDPWCSLFTDPLFSLQSPSSARDKIKTAGDLLTATFVLARSLCSLCSPMFWKERKEK